jgi:hypothetical protein
LTACSAAEYCVDCGTTMTGARLCLRAYKDAWCKCTISAGGACTVQGACDYLRN